MHDGVPAADGAGVGVVKHDPLVARMHKCVVVGAIVAHHAAQPVQVLPLGKPQVHLPEIQRLRMK